MNIREILLSMLFIPLSALSAIGDWDYMPFISYSGQYPYSIIKKGRNFELLHSLWKKPQSLDSIRKSGFAMNDVDTILLSKQGMIYRDNNIYHSAIPFIDSLATDKLRDKASSMAKTIIDETRPELMSFLSALDKAGHIKSAYTLVHSLVFDDIIWEYIDVSPEKANVIQTDSMTWCEVFYFYRPEVATQYGTNGLGLGEKYMLKFSWGNNSNAYLCTSFIKTNVLKALENYMSGEELNSDMLADCREYGVFDDSDRITIPILNGNDSISRAAHVLAKAASESFIKSFDSNEVADIIGWTNGFNETACKVILYHEVLSAIDKTLDDDGLLRIPEILKSEIPEDRKQTASVAYIMNL